MKRLNILVYAHELCPKSGSECSIGWNTIKSIARFHNLTIIHAETNQNYSTNYKNNIDEHISNFGKIKNVEFIAVPQPKINLFLSKANKLSQNPGIGFPLLYQFIYRIWQKKAYKISLNLLKTQTFHLVHQLTSLHIINPGYAHKLNIPFIWGPTGGLIKLKKSFLMQLDFKTRLRETLRNLLIDFTWAFSLNLKKALKKAALIYLFSKEDMKKIKSHTNAKLMLQIDTGTENEVTHSSKEHEEISAIWVGSISSRKCPELLFQSLEKIDFQKFKFNLIFVYTGNLTPRVKSMIEKIRRKINVVCKGNISKEEVAELMRSSSFLIHTSFREAASAVLLEAISNGLPIICHDVSGMAIAVNDDSGIKVPLNSYDESINLFAEAISKMISSKEIISHKTLLTLKNARELSWNKKGELFSREYLKVYEKNYSK